MDYKNVDYKNISSSELSKLQSQWETESTKAYHVQQEALDRLNTAEEELDKIEDELWDIESDIDIYEKQLAKLKEENANQPQIDDVQNKINSSKSLYKTLETRQSSQSSKVAVAKKSYNDAQSAYRTLSNNNPKKLKSESDFDETNKQQNNQQVESQKKSTISDKDAIQSKQEWSQKQNELSKQSKELDNNTAAKKIVASKANAALMEKQKEVMSVQNELNNLIKNNDSPTKINAAKEKLESIKNELPALQKNAEDTQKEYNKAKNESDKASRAVSKNQENDPDKIKDEQEKKEQQKIEAAAKKTKEKNDAAKKKIKSLLDKITDPTQNIHKTVCLKAGIIPSTAYAVKFCEYLKSHTEIDDNGECDWYIIDSNNNTKIDSKTLKIYKKEWILDRAGNKLKDNESKDAGNEEDNKESQEAKSDEEKLNKSKEKQASLETNLKKLNKDQKEITSLINKYESAGGTTNLKSAAQLTDAKTKLNKLQEKINKTQADLDKTKNDIIDLSQKISKDKEAAKKKSQDEKKVAKDKEKTISWFTSNLKSYRQKYLDDAHKNYGADKMKVIPDEVSVDELKQMAKYCAEHPELSNNLSVSDLSNSVNEPIKDSILKKIWAMKQEILSIKHELSPELLEKADAMTPNAAEACFNGAKSNTFELAKAGKALAENPQLAADKAKLLADATAAATAKITSRVTAEVSDSIMKLMDVTPITSIPAQAAQEMLKHIMTPADIMKKISGDMDPDFLATAAEQAVKKKVDEATASVNNVISQIKQTVGSKLETYNKEVTSLMSILNQGPMWYIDNINKLEVKYEKEIIQQIEKATIPALDAKFQFVDLMVSQVAYNLVAPVNQTLEKAQLLVLRKVVELKNKALAQAKSMAAAALMKILGLLGA